MKTFDIVVDMQKDFVYPDGKLYVPGADNIVDAYRQHLLSLTPENSAGVIFLFDTHHENYNETDEGKMFPEHCIKGTDGWTNVFQDIFGDIKVPVYTLEKGVFDMWKEDDVIVKDTNGNEYTREEFFATIYSKIDEFVVGGVVSEVCVKDALIGLNYRGYKTRVIPEHTKGLNVTIQEVINDHEFMNVTL